MNVKNCILRRVPKELEKYPLNLMFTVARIVGSRSKIDRLKYFRISTRIKECITDESMLSGMENRMICAIDYLDSSSKDMIESRFRDYRTLVDIGDKFNITDTMVSKNINNIINFMADYCISWIVTGCSNVFPIQDDQKLNNMDFSLGIIRILFKHQIYTIDDLLVAYKTIRYKTGRSILMDIDSIGIFTYNNIVGQLLEKGFIDFNEMILWKNVPV